MVYKTVVECSYQPVGVQASGNLFSASDSTNNSGFEQVLPGA